MEKHDRILRLLSLRSRGKMWTFLGDSSRCDSSTEQGMKGLVVNGLFLSKPRISRWSTSAEEKKDAKAKRPEGETEKDRGWQEESTSPQK